MYQKVGMSAYKKDLTNIRALLDAFGNPQQRFASLHIAGTNGKGTVTHLLSAIAQAAGWRTGLYVSPHYKDFRERVRIDGRYISKPYVLDFVARIKPLVERIQPSFFEISVAMAFCYFADRKADLASVEVGMGGRLDSTNILLPEQCVITNISFDHMQFLGDTLPLIAGEKAGIIKPGIPVLVGETHPETAPVFRAKAEAEGAPIRFADALYRATPIRQNNTHTWYRVERDGQVLYPELAVNLHGPYQHLNVQTALAAAEMWQEHTGRPLKRSHIETGLANLRSLTRFQGRWQMVREEPRVIVDSAHNEGGLRYAAEALLATPHRQLHVVFGMVQDKDAALVLPLLPAQARYYWVKANVPRGLDAALLRQVAEGFGRYGRAYSSVKNGLKAALRAAAPDDLVFVGGSVFVAAEVL
jgi:dihydrofolate synthase/folylpolyglutamate synthase